MVSAWIRNRSSAALLALGALALTGCKQDIGERCEQNSDCSSGLCGDGADMASAQGKKCVSTLTPPMNQTDASDAPVDLGTLYDAPLAVDTQAAELHEEAAASTEGGGAAAATEAGAD
ncbi:MAG TPA: hypothetical protein VHL80_07955 [Polyangia bacterium]|nr:hypothetical protein [Polyangia bacterium]